MRRYETFVIIDPDISKDDRQPVIERVKELITQMDGMLILVDEWGDRKLAYEIKKKTRGYYVRFDYCGLVALVNEIERFFRIDDRALKYMSVVLEKEADLEKIKEEMAAEQRKRELASAPPAESEPESKSSETETVQPVTDETPSEPPDTEIKSEPAPVAPSEPARADEVPAETDITPATDKGAADGAAVTHSDAQEPASGTTPSKNKQEA